jgi:histone H3/H4
VQATEDFMVHLLEDCNLCAIHAKRVTISKCLMLTLLKLVKGHYLQTVGVVVVVLINAL